MHNNRLTGLDLLRGLAAGAVFVFHLSQSPLGNDVLGSAPIELRFGELGVDTFFVISGYVILMTAERSRTRWEFIRARFIRLYPAFIACMVLTSIAATSAGIAEYELTPAERLANLTMFPSLFGARDVDAVYWTLGYEISFYAVVAALLPQIRRGRTRWLAACALLGCLLSPPPYGGNAVYFIIGIGLYEGGFIGLAISVAALLIAGKSALLPFALVVASTHVQVPAAISLWSGGISYPLYLLNERFGRVLLGLYRDLGAPPALAVTILAVVLSAAIVHRFVELPTQRTLRRLRWPLPAFGETRRMG